MQALNLRSAALAAAVAVPTALASWGAAAQQATLTQEQCNLVAGVMIRVARDAGPETLSTDFKQSLRAFIGNGDCRGPRVIYAPENRDVATYNTMRAILGVGSPPIALERNPGLVVRVSRAPSRQAAVQPQ